MKSQPNKRLAEQNAKTLFQRYVQRVAFSLTLSAPMIAALKYVRDDPGFESFESIKSRYGEGSDYHNIRSPNNRACLLVTEMHALERRGLVWFEEGEAFKKGYRPFKLTRIGELTCELLVEAGMLPRAQLAEKRKAA